MYMYGALLPPGPAGHGRHRAGQTTSTGSIGIIPPTLEITRTGQEEVIDGVRIVFQMTPGTECPVEMNFLFPDHRALCMAENATHNLHNLVTLRGALVRDARDLVPLPRRGHRPVLRRRRRGLRLPPLAHLGPRAHRHLPVPAAGPVRLSARPDPAADEPGATPGPRSPSGSSCRRPSTPPGTSTATTARSATT